MERRPLIEIGLSQKAGRSRRLDLDQRFPGLRRHFDAALHRKSSEAEPRA
jgi:hypothetical protein